MTIRTVWLLLVALCCVNSILGHSFDNRRLSRAEPLTNIHFEIAPRPETFFRKRSQTPNPGYTPTHPHAIQYDDILRLSINAYNQTFHLHLEPNLELFHADAVTWHSGESQPLRHEDYRIYRGHCVDDQQSGMRWAGDRAGLQTDPSSTLGWARVTIRQDLTSQNMRHPVFEGVFQAHGDLYHIKAISNFKRVRRSNDADISNVDNVHMVIYRDSDTVRESDEAGAACGFDNLEQNQILHQSPSLGRLGHLATGEYSAYAPLFDVHAGLLKRQAASGCPSSRKVAYMGAAADCTYTRAYGSVESARLQILTNWNAASAVYERTFNIQLGLINITIMPETCPSTFDSSQPWNRACSNRYSITNRLSDFSMWRAYMSDDGAALWHLMTDCATGSEVGVAWLRQVCTTDSIMQGSQYVSGTGVSSIIRDEWKVVAHEIGHGFGAIHDCTSNDCPCGSSCQCCQYSSSQCDAGGSYLMNPVNNASSEEFSPCTIQTVCGLYPTLGSCLEDPGSRTVQSTEMCGNGITEGSEDCDPGGKPSSCCDPATCKFINGATCDDATDLCCDNCQLRPSTYECRPSEGECDVAEFCTGTSGACPPDEHVADGTSCSGGMQCASGVCTSRDQQCRERGSELGITRACSAMSNTCQLVCQGSSSLSCVSFTGGFRDGTPCGSGVCKNSSCDHGSVGNRALTWLRENKAIAIPVGVVIGLILLLLLARCFLKGCCGWNGYLTRKRMRQAQQNGPQQVPLAPPPPPTTTPYHSQATHGPSNWVDPAAYNGPSLTTGSSHVNTPYSPPPPTYTQSNRDSSPVHYYHAPNTRYSPQAPTSTPPNGYTGAHYSMPMPPTPTAQRDIPRHSSPRTSLG